MSSDRPGDELDAHFSRRSSSAWAKRRRGFEDLGRPAQLADLALPFGDPPRLYGRTSATLELTGEARLASMSIATRRFTGDGSGATVAVESRHPGDATRDVAERMARALHGAEDPRIEAQSFHSAT
jgi:hypothetical protein